MTFFSTKDGRAILPLGLQTHNSSTGMPEMLEREIKAVKHFGGNLLEAPVYWLRIEAEEGVYNFDDVDDLILNTAGCLAGYGILVLIRTIKRKAVKA